MERLLYLLLLCSFLISCNTELYFFSVEELNDQNEDLSHSFERRVRRKRAVARNTKFTTNLKQQQQWVMYDPAPIQVPEPVLIQEQKYVYVRPSEENPVVFDEQIEFIQLAHNDVSSDDVSGPSPLVFTVKTNVQQKDYMGSSQLSQLDPVSVLGVPTVSQNTNEPVEVKKGSVYEEKGNVDIKNLPVINTKGLETVTPPELHLDVEVDEPDKVFIPRPLDVLFVIDTSESMHKNLMVFKEKFLGFLNYLDQLDWKIAITNADHGETGFFLFNLGALKGKAMNLENAGKVLNLRYLHSNIPNYNNIFLDSISRHSLGKYKKYGGEKGPENVGYCELPPGCQSLQEQPIKSLKAALGKNKGFFRKEADLIAIVISNSKERGNDQDAATQPIEVIEEFHAIHGLKKRFKVYGIIITEDDQQCLNQNKIQQFFFPEGAFSEKIDHLSEITGGEVFSICSSDYQALGQSVFNSFIKGWE